MTTAGADMAPEGRLGRLERLRAAVGVPDHVTCVVATTPSLRRSWLGAIAVATLLAAWSANVQPRLLPVLLIVAPIAPVGAVALAYGPWADPMYEITQATPTSGFRVLLLRTVAVLGASGALLGLLSVMVPSSDLAAGAWVLPALTLSVSSLMLATFLPLVRAAVLVAICWLAVVAWADVVGSTSRLFGGAGQLVFFAVAVGASFVLVRRRHHLEVEGLQARRDLVDAADAERRRIERNIHDGAQQQLVAIGVKAGLAKILVIRDPQRAISIIDELRIDAQEALDGLRDMTRGAYPPILADEGLEAALRLKAMRSPVPVTLDASATGRLPRPVEIAAYFCCLEAMQNAAKYARANVVTVSIRRQGAELAFSVRDDGAGFELSTVRRGVGMRSMVERVESLGGTFEMRSVPGGGTTISARLPITN